MVQLRRHQRNGIHTARPATGAGHSHTLVGQVVQVHGEGLRDGVPHRNHQLEPREGGGQAFRHPQTLLQARWEAEDLQQRCSGAGAELLPPPCSHSAQLPVSKVPPASHWAPGRLLVAYGCVVCAAIEGGLRCGPGYDVCISQ